MATESTPVIEQSSSNLLNENPELLSDLDKKEILALSIILWGNEGSDSFQVVFKRWSQGFMFSEQEPSALIQFEGGN